MVQLTREERQPKGQGQDGSAVRHNNNLRWVYRSTMLALWLGASAVMILDRFYWNVWPRQSICTDGCGTDFFCPMDEDPGCLMHGPWSVKAFDVTARISARFLISTTSLVFATMCHGTWNRLSELELLRPVLYNWREDNFWLHRVGGWTIGVVVLVHVWSLLLPSLVDGYENVKFGGEISTPLQVSLPGGNIDAANRQARWGVDDVWRIFWMTAIFGALMPLSRSAWALKRNFSLAMWLHMFVGAGFFFDSWRRRTHPHVWILNTPVVIWYLADKIWCSTRGRGDPLAEATRITLDEEYMVLLWKHKREDVPKRICDIFWLKRSGRVGNHAPRIGEMAHPFTTCSSHDVHIVKPAHPSSQESRLVEVRPTIEAPIRTDVSWPGHRFSLNGSQSRRSLTHSPEAARRSHRSVLSNSNRLPTVVEAFFARDDGDSTSSRSSSSSSIVSSELSRGDSWMGVGVVHEGGRKLPSLGGGRSLGLNPSEKSKGGALPAAASRPAATTTASWSGGDGKRSEPKRSDVKEVALMSGKLDRPPVAEPGTGGQEKYRAWDGKVYVGNGTTAFEAYGVEEKAGEDDLAGGTLIGVDTGDCGKDKDEITIVVGSLASWDLRSGRRVHPMLSREFSKEFFDDSDDGCEPGSADTPHTPKAQEPKSLGTPTPQTPKARGPVSKVSTPVRGSLERSASLRATPVRGPSFRGTPSRSRSFEWNSSRRPVPSPLLRKSSSLSESESGTESIAADSGADWFEDSVAGSVTGSLAEDGHHYPPHDHHQQQHGKGGGRPNGRPPRKSMVIKRLPTNEFQEFRRMQGFCELAGGTWDKMAIVRVHRREEPKVRECSCMGYTHVLSSFRRTETCNISDVEAAAEDGGVPLRTYGPYRSAYGRLGEFPNLPPILVIATGAGAALALDFVAYVRANKLVPLRPVTVCYSSASLALLQFTTNNLLAEHTPGIHIMTALTRHDDLEVFDTKAEAKGDLAIGRLDVAHIVEGVTDDTEVFFCGGGGINAMLREMCAKRGMTYVGSSVQ